MGCCMSKRSAANSKSAARWRSTGIVGLRDSNLKKGSMHSGHRKTNEGKLLLALHGYIGDRFSQHRVPHFPPILHFPSEVFQLERSVRTLDMTHNKLVEIPLEIASLANLQRLILSENLLGRLPITLGKLQSLKVLALDDNRLTTIPDELGLLVRLERLSISSNSLISLPETIGSLRNLVQLNVSGNHLKFLPESIGSCFSLEELLANGAVNQYVAPQNYLSIPGGVQAYADLSSPSQVQTLAQAGGPSSLSTYSNQNVGGVGPTSDSNQNRNGYGSSDNIYHSNSIEDLPLSLCRLASLKSLSLSNNHISQLPQNLLRDCTLLQSILLHENPISMEQFQQMVGYQEFESRRKRKFDKQIDSNVLMNSKGLDEGLDL